MDMERHGELEQGVENLLTKFLKHEWIGKYRVKLPKKAGWKQLARSCHELTGGPAEGLASPCCPQNLLYFWTLPTAHLQPVLGS